MIDKYILIGKTPKPIEDTREWAKAYETSNRRVAETILGNIRISTVFLGMDHSFGCGPPLLFETMIFGGKHDGYQDRYPTWEGAELGHAKAVHIAKGRFHRMWEWLCFTFKQCLFFKRDEK